MPQTFFPFLLSLYIPSIITLPFFPISPSPSLSLSKTPPAHCCHLTSLPLSEVRCVLSPAMAPASFWNSSKTVCVMDASGRLGSALVHRLLQRGYTVHAAVHSHGNFISPLSNRSSVSFPSSNLRRALFPIEFSDFEILFRIHFQMRCSGTRGSRSRRRS